MIPFHGKVFAFNFLQYFRLFRVVNDNYAIADTAVSVNDASEAVFVEIWLLSISHSIVRSSFHVGFHDHLNV
jgi:hypothetical protein